MVRIKLVPNIRSHLRWLQMGREMVQYSFIFLGITAVFCGGMVCGQLCGKVLYRDVGC